MKPTISPRIRAPMLFTLITIIALAATASQSSAQTTAKDYTPADAQFMQMMIVHHAQAVVMSNWAATHGARADVAILCKRIALSQYDEINLMQHWLQARNLSAPDPLHMLHPQKTPVVDRSSMHMPGMDMGNPPMMMAGMLTPAQMVALDAAHGTQFDRLYLTGMMMHHQGAIDMVASLFATPGGGQQAELFGYATDIDASQRVEINRMRTILQSLPVNPSPNP